jgi:hypothetical protein
MFIQFQLSSQLLLHSKESFEETVSWRKLFERLYRLALVMYPLSPGHPSAPHNRLFLWVSGYSYAFRLARCCEHLC